MAAAPRPVEINAGASSARAAAGRRLGHRRALALAGAAGLAVLSLASGGSDARAAQVATPPTGRGYELVSHRDTGGMVPYLPSFINNASRQDPDLPASADGERLIFMTEGPVPGGGVAGRVNIPYIAERGAGGWMQEYVGAPGDRVDISQLVATSSDLSLVLDLAGGGRPEDGGFVLGGRLDPADPDDIADIYARTADGRFSWVSPSPFASDDVTVFEMASGGDTWTYVTRPQDGVGHSPLLVWTPSGFEAVSILEDGPVTIANGLDASAGAPLSADGSRVAFVSRDVNGNGPLRIWVRLRDEERTVLASAPEAGMSDADLDADLDFFSADGTAVLFTTAQALTADDLDDQVDLYRFDVDAEDVELVSAAAPGAPSDGHASVCDSTYGVDGCTVSPGTYSADGSTAYFVSPEALDVGASSGAPNLYVDRDGVTSLVAVLADGDAPEAGLVEGTWRDTKRANRAVSVTDDGSRIVFESRARLTGYENAGAVEVYVYDADADRMWCASCAAASLGPNREASLRTTEPFRVTQGEYSTRGRNLTDDGGTVFFQTRERLVSKDINGVMDVYEYDVAADRVTLISSGAGSTGSIYIDNSADGEDVFFFSSDLLVSEDQDHNGNSWKIFDARRGGGFPAAAPRPGCGEADCRGALAPSPGFDGPAGDGASGNVSGRRVRLSLAAVGRRALARAARTGRLVVRVRRSSPGVVRVAARARIANRLRRVASGSRRVGRAGSARVVLRLSPRARRALARRQLRLTLSVAADGARPATRQLLLRRAGR
jgi:hypothetical protein